MLQVGANLPQPFAGGIEKLDIQYQLRRNCPPCDVVALPSSSDGMGGRRRAASRRSPRAPSCPMRRATIIAAPSRSTWSRAISWPDDGDAPRRPRSPGLAAPVSVTTGRVQIDARRQPARHRIDRRGHSLGAACCRWRSRWPSMCTSDTPAARRVGPRRHRLLRRRIRPQPRPRRIPRPCFSARVAAGAAFAEHSFALGDRAGRLQAHRAGRQSAQHRAAGRRAVRRRSMRSSTATPSERKPPTRQSSRERRVGAELLVGYIPVFQFIAFYATISRSRPVRRCACRAACTPTATSISTRRRRPLDIEDNPAAGVHTVQVSAGKGDLSRPQEREQVAKAPCRSTRWRTTIRPTAISMRETCRVTRAATTAIPADEAGALEGLDDRRARQHRHAQARHHQTAGQRQRRRRRPMPASTGTRPICASSCGSTRTDSCRAGRSLPYRIEVVDAGGHQDLARTATAAGLHERRRAGTPGKWPGSGPSTFPGTMPIFVTDVPFAAGSTCTNTDAGVRQRHAASYAPALPASPPPPLAPRATRAPVPASTRSRWEPAIRSAAPSPSISIIAAAASTTGAKGSGCCCSTSTCATCILWNQQNGEPFFPTTDRSDDGLVIFATIDGPASSGVNNYGIRIFGSRRPSVARRHRCVARSDRPDDGQRSGDLCAWRLQSRRSGRRLCRANRRRSSATASTSCRKRYWRSANPAAVWCELLRHPVLPRRAERAAARRRVAQRVEHVDQRRVSRRRRQHAGRLSRPQLIQRWAGELSALARELDRRRH